VESSRTEGRERGGSRGGGGLAGAGDVLESKRREALGGEEKGDPGCKRGGGRMRNIGRISPWMVGVR